ncbi:MAG: hypothetical protein ABEI99_09180 [Halobaculum sp.]
MTESSEPVQKNTITVPRATYEDGSLDQPGIGEIQPPSGSGAYGITARVGSGGPEERAQPGQISFSCVGIDIELEPDDSLRIEQSECASRTDPS